MTTAIASGDTEALGRFYEAWFDRMYAEARRITNRDESFCLDIVQDTMLRVIRNIKPMHDDASIVAWLRVVIRSVAYDKFRSEKRRVVREQRFAESRTPDEHSATIDEMDDMIAWLRTELESCDASDLQLLLMRHRFRWTLQRIGDAVGTGPGAVDGRLNRLIRSLRRKAKETHSEECS